jgi:transcriptional regulator with XRE-family HTH domain
LAERTGLSARVVTYYESGARLPTWDVVLTLCGVLGVDCGAFLQPPAQREARRPGRPRKAEPARPTPKAEATAKPARGRKPRKK